MIFRSSTPAPIAFSPLSRADMDTLHDWLARPHVAQWWGAVPSRADMEAEFAPLLEPAGPERGYIAHHADVPLGFIQSYTPAATHAEGWWLDQHDFGVRGIDQFLANAEQLGRGLGTAMVRDFVAQLFTERDVWRVQTDPDPTNHRAIRCYEKAGFRAVREIDTPDGRALLMYCDSR